MKLQFLSISFYLKLTKIHQPFFFKCTHIREIYRFVTCLPISVRPWARTGTGPCSPRWRFPTRRRASTDPEGRRPYIHILEREREKDTERETETERERKTLREREKDTERETETEKERERKTEREKDTERETKTEKETERERKTLRERQRKRDRQPDREIKKESGRSFCNTDSYHGTYIIQTETQNTLRT